MITTIEIIDFGKIFDTEKSEDYLSRIEEIPQMLLVEVGSYLASFHPDSDLVKDHKVLLSKWFGKENNGLANAINDKINQYNKSTFGNTGILNPRTSGLAPYKSDNFILNFKSTHNSL